MKKSFKNHIFNTDNENRREMFNSRKRYSVTNIALTQRQSKPIKVRPTFYQNRLVLKVEKRKVQKRFIRI